MRVKVAINVVISEDDDQLIKLGPDINVIIDDNASTTKKHKAGKVILAGGAGEQAYSFTPEVTNGKFLIVLVKAGAVKVRLNNAATGFSLKPNPAVATDPLLPYQVADQPGMIYIGPMGPTNPLTQMHLLNESATVEATVIVALVGEAS